MVDTIPAVFKIVPTTQQYDLGKKGRTSSSVAQFAEAYNIKIDDRSAGVRLCGRLGGMVIGTVSLLRLVGGRYSGLGWRRMRERNCVGRVRIAKGWKVEIGR
jgi:hypothetical protein